MSTVASGTNIATISNSDGSSDGNALPQDKILTITFNQDCTSLAIGTVKSYALFTINQNNKMDENHDYGIKPLMNGTNHPFEDVRIIERVFSSPFIAVISNQAPRNLNLFDITKDTMAYANKFTTNILAVKFSRSRIVVCLAESISIFYLRSLRVLYTIGNIPPNYNGLCALSPTDDNAYLAYPGSSTKGEIHIFDTHKLEDGVMIKAHDGPLVAMSFDMSGTKIATASDKGTVIRIHSAVDGSRLFEFRRGSLRAATIYSLAFSPHSMFLAASSNTGTIHIFRLTDLTTSTPQETSTWIGYFGRAIGGAASYVSKPTSEIFTQDRSFATVHLQSTGLKTTIAMNNLNGKLILYVAGYDGVASTYEVNTTDGGECKQLSQYVFFNLSMSSIKQPLVVNNVEKSSVDKSSGEYPPNLFKTSNETIPKSST